MKILNSTKRLATSIATETLIPLAATVCLAVVLLAQMLLLILMTALDHLLSPLMAALSRWMGALMKKVPMTQ